MLHKRTAPAKGAPKGKTMPRTYRNATRPEAETYIHHDVEAFGGDAARLIKMLDDDREMLSRIRVVADDDAFAAGLSIFDVGQWFGGRRLRSWAIGGLITAAHYRGAGVGRRLLLGMLHEARDAGVPLSVLYGSTPTFYRKCGYEPAGYICAWGVDSHFLPRTRTDAKVVPFGPDDQAVRECYAAAAAASHGVLDRNDWMWRNKIAPHQGKRFGYRFEFDGRTEGYLSLNGDRSDGLGVEDYAATTLRARQAILTFLHDHRSVNQHIAWYGGPNDPLRLMIPENRARPRRHTEEWMLRIADVGAALAQRGYPALDAELSLDVTDASMPDNAGRYRLALRRGTPTVERGGDGRVALEVRGLAALFTSHATAEELAAAGLAEGPADDLALASLVFAGPRPFMVDKF